MVTTQNFTAQISQPRRTELKPTVGGFDATLSVGPAFEEERTTTFQRFHEIAPAEARKGPAPPEKGDDDRAVGGYPASVNPVRPDAAVYSTSRAFFIKNATDRDFFGHDLRRHQPGVGPGRSMRREGTSGAERGGGGVQERVLGVGG